VRITSVAARTLRWPIASEGAARGRAERAAVIVELRCANGVLGLGEAAPLPGLSRDTLDDAERAIADLDAGGAVASSPAAQFALETALLDALGRSTGRSVADLLTGTVSLLSRSGAATLKDSEGLMGTVSLLSRFAASPSCDQGASSVDRPQSPVFAAAVPLAAVVDDPDSARRHFAAGIRCFKIKLATDDDPARVTAIAAAVPDARLRIDANRSWPRAEVHARLAALARLPIDYVEEPCIDSHQLLDDALPMRLALDESLATIMPDELDRALRSPQLAALVLKPTLLGGLSAVLALADRARQAGVAAIVSHGLEGPIGTAACASLALALGGSHAVGLAAHPALAAWHLSVPQLTADHLRHAAEPGLGFGALDLAGILRSHAPRLDKSF
jgi:L-alanine-DL-glutamate epimerase-like enolase superfamily enzyme